MMKRRYASGALLCVTLFAAGCVPTSRTYDVRVKNQTSAPLTLWLTKNGPPAEHLWEPPEALAQRKIQYDDKVGGVVVAPGAIATTGPRTGKFFSDTGALLRIYAGERNFSEILSIGRGSPNRLDYDLAPGKNDLVVTDPGGALRVQERGPVPSSK